MPDTIFKSKSEFPFFLSSHLNCKVKTTTLSFISNNDIFSYILTSHGIPSPVRSMTDTNFHIRDPHCFLRPPPSIGPQVPLPLFLYKGIYRTSMRECMYLYPHPKLASWVISNSPTRPRSKGIPHLYRDPPLLNLYRPVFIRLVSSETYTK